MKKPVRTMAVSLLLACSLTMSAFAATDVLGTGMATDTGLHIRSDASISAPVLTALSSDATVDVPEVSDGWYKVSSDETEGFVSAQYLAYADNEVTEAAAPVYGIVTGSSVNLRNGAGTSFEKIASLKAGTKVTILETLSGWYQVSYNGTVGYMSADYVRLTDGESSVGEQVVELAMEYLGYKYVSGGASPSSGFDCSGFAMYLYAQFGYSIPHSSKTLSKYGLAVSKDELQPGDLVFFRSASSSAVSHVGIYIGNGEIIHARYSIRKVAINSLSESYYSKYYVGAARVVY